MVLRSVAKASCAPVRSMIRRTAAEVAHGVWGGLVEEERRAIRRRWLAGTGVTEFLQDQPARLPSPHGYGETSRWLSTVATPGAAAAAALAAAASCSECTCP